MQPQSVKEQAEMLLKRQPLWRNVKVWWRLGR